MADDNVVLNAITNLHSEMSGGFDKVYKELGNICSRIKPLEDDKVARDALAGADKKTAINWSAVKTGAAIIASGSLTLAALKFLLLNVNKWMP